KLPQLADETRYLNTLDEQVAHLTRTLQDMLDMSHLDDDIVEFNFRRLNLNGLVRDVLTGLKSEADEKRHSMIFIADPDAKQIMADQVMMGRVITHLIQNAIFYTPAGGSITVRTSYRDDRVILQVQDNGIGIDASEIPNIFDRFYKIDQARPVQNSGTGLGLSIVKKIVEAHNGTIHVISTPGKGSTFSVSLPTSSITTTREVAIIQPTTDYGVDYGF
ncbi:MAG: HAMP domain-containing histidine kinase, partial [Anaerolineae bacterium]|nr:HAMP domain-containing histidine kinase [Anaerolineae bacterium]